MLKRIILLVASILFAHQSLKAAEVRDCDNTNLNFNGSGHLRSMADFSRASSIKTVFSWGDIASGDFRIVREKFMNIENVQIHAEGCKNLSSWIGDFAGWATLKSLGFNGKINYETREAITGFTPDALKELNAVLKTLPQLTSLSFMGSNLTPLMIPHLAEGIASLPALEGLGFIHSPIGTVGLRVILENASPTLKVLTFINSNFTDIEIDTIVEILGKYSALEFLLLEQDAFSPDALKRLASALLGNEKLNALSVHPKETTGLWREDFLGILSAHPNAKNMKVDLIESWRSVDAETLSSEEDAALKAYEATFKELRLKPRETDD
jgi:hypothetical protein